MVSKPTGVTTPSHHSAPGIAAVVAVDEEAARKAELETGFLYLIFGVVVVRTHVVVLHAAVQELEDVEGHAPDVVLDLEHAAVEVGAFGAGGIVVLVDPAVEGNAAADGSTAGFGNLFGEHFAVGVGNAGDVDGENKCFVDFEIIGIGPAVVYHIVFKDDVAVGILGICQLTLRRCCQCGCSRKNE